MSFPKQSEIELPLLKTLQELGGKAEPKELYPRLAAIFPQLTQEDLAARLPSSPSTFRWHNLVQWSRQKLVEKGDGVGKGGDGDDFDAIDDGGFAGVFIGEDYAFEFLLLGEQGEGECAFDLADAAVEGELAG